MAAGSTILPDLIRQNRAEYIDALRAADEALKTKGEYDVGVLHAFLTRLLKEQLEGKSAPDPA